MTNEEMRKIMDEENFMIDVQFLIERLIIDRKISLKDLAKSSSIPKKRLAEIRRSGSDISLRELAKIAQALNSTVRIAMPLNI